MSKEKLLFMARIEGTREQIANELAFLLDHFNGPNGDEFGVTTKGRPLSVSGIFDNLEDFLYWWYDIKNAERKGKFDQVSPR